MKLVSTGGKHYKENKIDEAGYQAVSLGLICGTLMFVSCYLLIKYVILEGV